MERKITMGHLETLTKEELLEWIRENNPEIDEARIVMQTLRNRSEYFSQKITEFLDMHQEIQSKIDDLINPYIPVGAKSGTKLNVPPEVLRQYKVLEKERDDAWREYKAWSNLDRETSQKMLELAKAT